MNEAQSKTLKSVVTVSTFVDGTAEIIVTGSGRTLSLETVTDGPTVGLKDSTGHVIAAFGVETNGHFRGWIGERDSDDPSRRRLAWFPARK